jgi:ribonuclease Z
MKLTILGTSSMVPTKERNVSGHYLDYKGEGILFDCGEGTQRQMNIAGINRNKVKKILITHWHGDHVSGLVGLIQTLGNKEEEHSLLVFGPKGTKQRMKHLLNSCIFENKVEIKIKELDFKNTKTFYENEDYLIQAINVYHSVPVVAYRFVEKDKIKVNMAKLKRMGVKEGTHIKALQEGKNMEYEGKKYKLEEFTSVLKGKTFAYVPDTDFGPNCIKIAENVDVLLCESTYGDKYVEKARKRKHLTSKEAAQIASQANAKKLILTHFSQRYKNIKEVLGDAKDVFPNTEAAFDFMKISF